MPINYILIVGRAKIVIFSYTLSNKPLLITIGVFSNNIILTYVQRTYTSNCSRCMYAQIYAFTMQPKATFPYLHFLHFLHFPM